MNTSPVGRVVRRTTGPGQEEEAHAVVARARAPARDHILRIVAAIRLLGAVGVLVGIQAEIAQMFVGLGVDLGRVRVHQNLREALKACMRDAQPA